MQTCFVMMPFGGTFDNFYEEVLKPAILKSGLEPVRADEIFGVGSLMAHVHEGISQSKICLADITGRNPNVSYELGMAHCLNKPVFIITQNVEDVPFDYKHLRIAPYNPKTADWKSGFANLVTSTIKEVLKDPNSHAVFPVPTKPHKALLTHFTNIYFSIECMLGMTDDIHYIAGGHALIETTWEFQTKSPVFHICHNLVTERPGKIEVFEAHDVFNGRQLDVLEIERGDAHLTYMVILKQFKNPNQSFEIKTKARAEHYLDGLIEGGRVRMGQQAAQRSGIRYKYKVERYHFPLEEPFENIVATYKSHPNSEEVDKIVRCSKTAKEYLLELKYIAEEPYRQETGSIISLGSGR